MKTNKSFESMLDECETFGKTLVKDFTDYIPYHQFRCTIGDE